MKKRKRAVINPRLVAVVLPFRKKKRSAKTGRKGGCEQGPGTVLAFPLIRLTSVVRAIVDEMRDQPSLIAAENVLIEHLEIECRRLEQIGLPEEAVERNCRSFAGTAWAAALRCDDDDSRGGAA